MLRFSLTVAAGAFLLFEIQPVVGKAILPWFGGGPAVWTVCLLFFQSMLLAGYGYAHWIGSRSSGRWLHLFLLSASLLFLPVTHAWRPFDAAEPTRRILSLLAMNIGLPYFLLSSTGPLMQRWFHTSFTSQSPYPLYALSNAASLAALLLYPFVIEPVLPLRWQERAWSVGYAAFVVLCALCSIRQRASADGGIETKPRPGIGTLLYWLALAACGSILLVATTNQMCREVAVTPFLWVLPLAIYLLTFLVAFDREHWYDRRWYGLLAGISVPAACALVSLGMAAGLSLHVLAYSIALFVCCMICHGELARSKPDPAHLTLFYLVVAAGGALGGGFVAVLAPRLFHDYSEFYIGLAGACLLALEGWRRSRFWIHYRHQQHWILSPLTGLALATAAAAVALVAPGEEALDTQRNFYGVLRVAERTDDNGPKRVLTHGRIMHGFQYTEAGKRAWPTSYYSPTSGIGVALDKHPRTAAGLKVGLVGLGVGTVAAYGRSGDLFRFYEIDRDVDRFSDLYFTYRKDSPARIEVVLGDARIRLEQGAARDQLQGFDVLAIDAFTSDAIPTHLLTAECFDLYRRHLKPGGLLLFHITNRSLDLTPVVRALALRAGWRIWRLYDPGDDAKGASRSTWMALSAEEIPWIQATAQPFPQPERPPLLWTDDFSSLWRILRF